MKVYQGADISSADQTESRLEQRSIDALPGPRGLPLLGNALQIQSDRMHSQLEGWARQYGPFYRLRIISRRIMVVADHHAIGTLLRDRP